MICRPLLTPNGPTGGSGGRCRIIQTRWLGARCTLFATAIFCLAGCSSEDPRLKSLREQFVIRSESIQPTTIADAKEMAAEDTRVEFVGQIGANELEVFTPGKASFVVTEILSGEPGHSGAEHASNCPFCKRKAAQAPRAAVKFVDAAGDTLAIDARKLFGIEPGDTVVIRGAGELIPELDMFVVTADGIQVQRSEGRP